MADLLFTRLYELRSGRSVELNFNPQSTPAVFNAAVEITTDDAVVSSVAVSVRSVANAVISFFVDDVICTATADYDPDVSRGIGSVIKSIFAIAPSVLTTEIQGDWQQPLSLSPICDFSWQDTDTIDAVAYVDWYLPPIIATGFLVNWQYRQQQIASALSTVYQSPAAKFAADVLVWQLPSITLQSLSSDWYCPIAKFNSGLITFQKAIKLGLKMAVDSSGAAALLQQLDVIVWQAASVPWVVNKPIVPFVIPPKYWSTDLVFGCQKPVWVNGKQTILVFKLIGCPWPILPFIKKQRAYVIVNEVAVYRLPEMILLDVLSVNITGDVDSWAWSFTATLKTHRQLDLVKPDTGGNPREIRVIVNGEWWDFIVEGRSTPREFGNSSITIKGRSLSAYLAEPFAPITDDSNASDVLANQIADLAVLNTGWSVDWQLTDWLVLAGAWNYRGAPMGRLLQIADGVGGVVASAPAAKSVSLAKRYPVLPWNWAAATPYAQIPVDVMVFLGGESDKKPDYNGVYVAGESVGVGALVKRQGTAGDVLAPTKINPLLTHIDACRMAGESILAEAGAVELIPFVMPVEPTLGILPLNELLEIDDGGDTFRGMTRSIQISALWGDSLVVRQTVEIERRG